MHFERLWPFVFVVGNDGAIYAAYYANNAWNGPIPVTATEVVSAGTHLAAAAHPGVNQLDLFWVDGNGAINAIWARGLNAWNGPAPLTGNSLAPAGASLAAGFQAPAQQNSNQLDLFYSDVHGTLDGQGVQGLGLWSAPIALSPSGFAPAGAPVATVLPTSTQLDVFVATSTGLNFTYEQNDGMFNTPAVICPP
jgi:hypothetical protein